MVINKDVLCPYLLYSAPVPYNGFVVLYPVKMKDILDFQIYSQSITVRKDSRFSDKNIIKMSYLEFLVYAADNEELEETYNFPKLHCYYTYLIMLLNLVCKDQEVKFNEYTGDIFINNVEITPEILDDIRRIIIIQNDIDFDIDEFINYDTELRLQKAANDSNKTEDRSTLEDYIDSIKIVLGLTEEEIMDLSVRKFWRLVKRCNLHENYLLVKSGEYTGALKLKEPIKHWMSVLEDSDKYSSYRTDENELKNKISQSN